MLKIFLFYFFLFLCLPTFTSCHKRSDDTPIAAGESVRWVVDSSTDRDFAQTARTLSYDGLYHLEETSHGVVPVPSFEFEVRWPNSQTAEFFIPRTFRNFSTDDLELALKESFQADDPILIDALTDLIWNAKEYEEKRLPWSMVGIKSARGVLRIQLRRKAPQLLAWILSHPATWAKPPRHDHRVEISRLGDPLGRATMVEQAEADLASDLPKEILPIIRSHHFYTEIDGHRRLFFLFTPRSQALLSANHRRYLIDVLDPRDFVRFSDVPVMPLLSLLSREPEGRSGKPFDSTPPSRSAIPTSQLFSPLTVSSWTPLEEPTTTSALNEAANHIALQLARVGITATLTPPSTKNSTLFAAASNCELLVVALPPLPLLGRSWGDLFAFLGRGLSNPEYTDLLDRWNFSRDDEKQELIIEKILAREEFLIAPYVALRRPILARPGKPRPVYSAYGHWDWTTIAKR